MNLNGFSKWFDYSGNDEFTHANKVIWVLKDIYENYVFPDAIVVPVIEENLTLIELVKEAYKVERETTKQIGFLKEKAEQENEPHIYSFLVEFAKEQLEEEAKLKTLLDELSIVQDNPAAILMLDKHYAK